MPTLAAPTRIDPPLPAADWALFLDVDGTLLDIAERPDEVAVPRTLIETLRRATDAFGGALAFVSGRTIAELDQLFDPLRLPTAGQHGAEMRLGGTRPAMRVVESPSAALRQTIANAMSQIADVLVEDKGLTVAVHYRARPELGDALAAQLAALIQESGETADLMAGKFVWEVRPMHRDKGQAVKSFMADAPFKGRRPVFIGDDVTDADGFAMVEQLGGIALPVGDLHTPRAAAFHDAAAVRDWLRDFVAGLEGGAS
ncbi:trehalose-phosphatase [Desertibaculum subflavum]|uniref:trehalose-phosphatase n=1 Tax=Desertibaculum subflavum TaxID=2268458 RepID=UPI0013C502F1